MESTKQPQSVTVVDEIDANNQQQSHYQIESVNSTNMRVGDEMEMKCMIPPSFVNPEFVEVLQELADQFDAHEKYEEEALDLISELYGQMAERGDDPSALTQLKNRIGELKYLLYYNQIVVSELFNAKHELIEIALYQNELALYYQSEMGVEPSTSGVSSSEPISEIGHGCCFAMLAKLRAWASEVGKWILNLLCLSRMSVEVE